MHSMGCTRCQTVFSERRKNAKERSQSQKSSLAPIKRQPSPSEIMSQGIPSEQPQNPNLNLHRSWTLIPHHTRLQTRISTQPSHQRRSLLQPSHPIFQAPSHEPSAPQNAGGYAGYIAIVADESDFCNVDPFALSLYEEAFELLPHIDQGCGVEEWAGR